jgi:hypothetical protein
MTNILCFRDLDKVNIWLLHVLLVTCIHTSYENLHSEASRVLNNISKFQIDWLRLKLLHGNQFNELDIHKAEDKLCVFYSVM